MTFLTWCKTFVKFWWGLFKDFIDSDLILKVMAFGEELKLETLVFESVMVG